MFSAVQITCSTDYYCVKSMCGLADNGYMLNVNDGIVFQNSG